jgi:hypothetical protein
MYLDAAGRLLPRARVIAPLVDLPLDLWVAEPGAERARPWPEPSQVSPRTPAGTPAPPGGGTGGAEPGETWREKLQRLQERSP